MSLGIKKFCPYKDMDCPHRCGWEVDGVDEYGRHVITFEFECKASGNGCAKERSLK